VVFIQRERLTRTVVMAEKLDREIKLARDIQMSTLPSDMPRVPATTWRGSSARPTTPAAIPSTS